MVLTAEQQRQQKSIWAAYHAAHACYFLQHGAGGLIKIGFSVDIPGRMRAIQINCPLPLFLLGWRFGGPGEESRMHRRFAASRAWGEWYRPTEELIEFCATETEHGPWVRPAYPTMPWNTPRNDAAATRRSLSPSVTPTA